MLFVIYSQPGSAEQSWGDLRLGTICDAIEWNYTKRFCGAGTFSLTIPRTSLFASRIEVGCMLALTNNDEFSVENRYEGFIVKDVLRNNDAVKITGYDLNGLLLDRVTLAETRDGKDAQSGATETIVKHYVAANCVESADADRNFPGLETAKDKGRGLVNDAASPRLSRVSDVINDILGAAGMGYRIYPAFNRRVAPDSSTSPAAIVFDVFEETNRTDEQSENTRVIFSYRHGNITEMTRETGVTADRNTFYCEYNGGYVTRYDKKSNDNEAGGVTAGSGTEQGAKYSGYGRREEFLELSCELGEIGVYAEHEIADRYRETDSLEIVAGNPLDYGRVYNVGDIATVYDRDKGVKLNSVISAVEIKKTATEQTVKITLGDAKPKPLDLLGKSGGAVAAVIRQDVLSSTSARAASYEYLSDVSVKLNGVTYTVEKNENGLISKISDDKGNALEPEIGGDITDIALHNAVFWAAAMAKGFGRTTNIIMPVMDGITGYFIPDTRNIPMKRWDNYQGGNPINFTGCSQNGDALHVNSDEYGTYETTNPSIYYAVFKLGEVVSLPLPHLGDVILKHVTHEDYRSAGRGFNILMDGDGYPFFSGSTKSYDLRQTVHSAVADYAVVCCVRNGSTASYYINGTKIGTVANYSDENYAGNYYINWNNQNGTIWDSTYPMDFMALAFGTTPHAEEQIQANIRWLQAKYAKST